MYNNENIELRKYISRLLFLMDKMRRNANSKVREIGYEHYIGAGRSDTYEEKNMV